MEGGVNGGIKSIRNRIINSMYVRMKVFYKKIRSHIYLAQRMLRDDQTIDAYQMQNIDVEFYTF